MKAVIAATPDAFDALDVNILDSLALPDPVDVGGGRHAAHDPTTRYQVATKHPTRDEWAYPVDDVSQPIVTHLIATCARFAGLTISTLDASWTPPPPTP